MASFTETLDEIKNWMTIYPLQSLLVVIVFALANYIFAEVAARRVWSIMGWFLVLTLLPVGGFIIMLVVAAVVDLGYFSHQRSRPQARSLVGSNYWHDIRSLNVDRESSRPPDEHGVRSEKNNDEQSITALKELFARQDPEFAELVEHKLWGRAAEYVENNLNLAKKLRNKRRIEFYESLAEFLKRAGPPSRN